MVVIVIVLSKITNNFGIIKVFPWITITTNVNCCGAFLMVQ